MKIDRSFQTDDILLCAFLLTQGVSLVDIWQDRPKHFTFLLSNPSECNSLKSGYINGAVAPAQLLFSKREMLIGEIKSKLKVTEGSSAMSD